MIKILKNKLEQFIRLVYVNSITLKNDSVILVEYPKSGGTWLGQLVSNYLDIPFPRNQFPTSKRAMFHSHYLPKYNLTKNKNIVYLLRDGRDVIISLYFHQLLWNEKNKLSPKDVNYHRSQVPFSDYENIKENLAEFIKYTFEANPSKIQHFTYMGNWYEYNMAWLREMESCPNIVMVKYEDLLANTENTLRNLLSGLLKVDSKMLDTEKIQGVVNKFSFENQAKRKKGEENVNSFLRKGIHGDWKNYFGEKEKELFKFYTKDLLVKLNYEKDTNW